MTVRITTAAKNAMLDALTGLIGNGGKIEIRTGAQPASADDAATGTLLVTLTGNSPTFDAAAGGVAALDVAPAVTGTGVAAGTAGWARITTSAGTGVMDVAVTATGGGGQLELNTTAVSIGLTLTVTAFTITEP